MSTTIDSMYGYVEFKVEYEWLTADLPPDLRDAIVSRLQPFSYQHSQLTIRIYQINDTHSRVFVYFFTNYNELRISGREAITGISNILENLDGCKGEIRYLKQQNTGSGWDFRFRELHADEVEHTIGYAIEDIRFEIYKYLDLSAYYGISLNPESRKQIEGLALQLGIEIPEFKVVQGQPTFGQQALNF